jgi:hypothetical protein
LRKDKPFATRSALSSRRNIVIFAPMRCFGVPLLLLALIAPAIATTAASAKIDKVLPHLLDLKGRHMLSPSLYERDAYQAFLRAHPDKCSALRFDVKWKAQFVDSTGLKLRIEIRGSKEAKPVVLEQPIEPKPWYNRWTHLSLESDTYQRVGDIIAWRATLWDGEKLLAQQKSFLW